MNSLDRSERVQPERISFRGVYLFCTVLTLLKDGGSVLPFGSGVTSIAVIGIDASTSPQTDGGGSAGVNSSGTVTPLQGITARAGSGVKVSYNDGSNASSAASL